MQNFLVKRCGVAAAIIALAAVAACGGNRHADGPRKVRSSERLGAAVRHFDRCPIADYTASSQPLALTNGAPVAPDAGAGAVAQSLEMQPKRATGQFLATGTFNAHAANTTDRGREQLGCLVVVRGQMASGASGSYYFPDGGDENSPNVSLASLGLAEPPEFYLELRASADTMSVSPDDDYPTFQLALQPVALDYLETSARRRTKNKYLGAVIALSATDARSDERATDVVVFSHNFGAVRRRSALLDPLGEGALQGTRSVQNVPSLRTGQISVLVTEARDPSVVLHAITAPATGGDPSLSTN